ncbi:hypothetical protein [Methylobacterium radiodurans]|uniref:Outer membrane efflux protein n=1 Tax=Methylobacterium radiodurans TaxID=2202828 RepID=A0A2U8VUJ8_9HYPH|nr:hypothetical protein [Methylobacterium radiodurans]AWN37397.1 hypothetical protein DK427_18105 [Methylobacterium radiodurans]
MRIPTRTPTLRMPTLCLLAALALPGAAEAQVTPDLNSWNRSLSYQSDMRSQQLSQTSELNTLRMQAQRNVQFAPAPIVVPGVVLRRGGFSAGGPRHSGVRAGRTGRDRSLDTGICVGC